VTPPALITARRTAARRLRRTLRSRRRIGRSVRPLSNFYGYDRGTPVDRLYINEFLSAHSADIRGRVLDIGDDHNSREFGSGVTRTDILYPVEHPNATVVGNLETGDGIPRDSFDCVLLLETLGVIYDVRRAVQAVHDALVPGGVVLCTANGMSQIERDWPDYWRFTDRAMQRLFAEAFGEANVTVTARGNVYAATAYLYGASLEEMDRAKLEPHDPRFQVSICVRARRPV
jgi:SAM-dependent methyltransferase